MEMEDFCAAIGKTRSFIPHHTTASGRWLRWQTRLQTQRATDPACETINGLTEVRVLTGSGGCNKTNQMKNTPDVKMSISAFESHTETSENFEKASLQLVHPTHGHCGPRDNVRMTHGSMG